MKRPLPALVVGLALAAGAPGARAQQPGSAARVPGGSPPREAAAAGVDDVDLATLLDSPRYVWTATRTEQEASKAAAIITTVTREQILAWGYRSVAEVLDHLLGFYVVDDHTAPNLAVRGTSGGLYADSSVVKVLVDGHSVAFHSTAGNLIGPELIPLSVIERIEIIRGPASALFGADAFLGVINIKTRPGRSLDGAAASVGMGVAGQHLATDLDASAGGEKGPVDVLVAVRRTSQDLSGIAVPPSPADRAAQRQAEGLDQRSTSGLARMGYRTAGGELGAFAYASSFSRGAALSPPFQGVGGAENRVSLEQWRAGLFLERQLGSQLRLSVRGSTFRGAPGDDDRLEIGNNAYYLRRQFGFRGGDLDAQIEWSPQAGPGQGALAGWLSAHALRLVAGASTFVDDEQLPSRVGIAKQPSAGVAAGDPIDAISVYQPRKTFLNDGAFLQGIVDVLGDRLAITAGLRSDWHNVYGQQIAERLGVVSALAPHLHAKLLYGSAFKAPSPLLLYAVPDGVGDVVGNGQLRPQHARTSELQLSYDPASSLSLSSNLAYTSITDEAEFVQQGIYKEARNVAQARTLSWETLLELRYRALLRGHLSLEAQRTVRQTGQSGYAADLVGSRGDIYPGVMVHAGAIAQPPAWPVRLAVAASYIGSRRASDTNILLNTRPYVLPAYLRLEAGLTTIAFHPLGRGMDVSFSLTGKNLLGATGPTPGFSGVDYPLAPRTVFLQTNLAL